jgi:3-oxoacyl-[acyl-carrier-protein] synthase-1
VEFPGGPLDGLPSASPIPGLGDAIWPKKAETLVTPAIEEALSDAGIEQRSDLIGAYRRESIFVWLGVPARDRPGVDRSTFATFLSEAKSHCIVDLPAAQMEFLESGHAAGLLAVEAAMESLAAGQADLCVLGGVDSLLETELLLDLLRHRRVKTDSTPDGAVPGEGAAFVVLEREEDARRRGARPWAKVLAATSGEEPVPLEGGEPATAAGLSAAMHRMLDRLEPEKDTLGDVFNDLNGERGRFREWAIANGRCLQSRAYGFVAHHPASATGDLGTATGAMNLALAARMLGAGNARGSHVMVCGMSEPGERAAVLLAHTPGRNGP